MLAGDVPATEVERQALANSWGVTWPGWPDFPWTTRIRILFVIDGRITQGSGPDEFGLGLVLQTLRDISFAYWVRFDVTVENRDDGFRFDDGFDIDRFDQIWFFGDWPGEEANYPDFLDSQIEDDGYQAMEDGELQRIATWMNQGGGVFATGDHALLGASMCHKIPRVRSMRKWTRAQGVPSFADADRHETLQDVLGVGGYAEEGDRWPQPIYPVFRRDTDWPWIFGQWPHPLLCGRDSVIDEFPDHMHEGAVIEDADVVLTDPLLAGSAADEYPIVPIVVSPGIAAGPPIGGDGPILGRRPRPEVIAHGMTTNGDQARRPFGLIGVYDGDPIPVGRVVVDSTWHHWFSMNLVGLRDEAPGYYRNMQAYFRNVALWLATPAQRASMLFWATWGVLVGTQPGLLSPALGVWGMGERVVDVIGRTAPQCIVSELIGPIIRDRARSAPPPVPKGAEWEQALRPSAVMANQAIVGGIAIGMFDLAKQHQLGRVRGRIPRIDPGEIRARGAEGIAIGTKALQGMLATAAERFGALAEEPLDERYADLVGQIQVGETLVDQQEDDQKKR